MGLTLIRNPLVHLLLVALTGLAAYSSTFDVPFMFDDTGSILDNPLIKDFKYFISPSLADGVAEKNQLYIFESRYVAFLTLALNYRMGGLDPAGYHAVNLAVHILNALLVYLLVRLMARTPLFSRRGGADQSAVGFTAFLAAALFVAHPVQTQAVTYIVQRMASLVALFYVLSLALYAMARLYPAGRRSQAAYVFSFLFALLAMKTKENSATLPFVLFLCEFYFFQGRLKARARRLLPFFLAALVVPLTLLAVSARTGGIYEHGLGDPLSVVAQRDAGEMFKGDYLLTELRVVVTYLRLLVLPFNLNFDYDYPMYRGLLSAPVLVSATALLALVWMGVYFFRRSRETGQEALRLISFGIFWFFITLSIEAGPIPISDVIFEHRLYLPSVGALIAIASAAVMMAGRLKGAARNASFVALTLVPLLFACAAYARNEVWRDEVRTLEDMASKSPGKAKVHSFLGNAYLSRGMVARAVEEQEEAVRLSPKTAAAHSNLGTAYRAADMHDKALEHYLIALRLNPKDSSVHNSLGNYYSSKGMAEEAVEHYLAAIRLAPSSKHAHFNLAREYASTGRTAEAIEHYREAIRLDPSYLDARRNLGLLYMAIGDMEAARREYEAATGSERPF